MGFFEMIGAAFAVWIGWTVVPILVVIFLMLTLIIGQTLWTAIDDKIKSYRRKKKS